MNEMMIMILFIMKTALEAFVEYLNEEKDVTSSCRHVLRENRMALKLNLLSNLMMVIQKLFFHL